MTRTRRLTLEELSYAYRHKLSGVLADELDRARAREQELEAKLKDAVADLVEWGHDSRCARHMGSMDLSGECDCGMDKIVAKLRVLEAK